MKIRGRKKQYIAGGGGRVGACFGPWHCKGDYHYRGEGNVRSFICSSSNRGGARYLLGFEERGELQLAVAAIAVYILRVPPILLLLDFTDRGCRPDITSYSGTWL